MQCSDRWPEWGWCHLEDRCCSEDRGNWERYTEKSRNAELWIRDAYCDEFFQIANCFVL